MDDVLIVGAGPAGAVAAAVLARAGAHVRLVDRARFPRPKLCGDTINPGTLAMLRRLNMAGVLEQKGLRVDGMIVTSEQGVSIEGRYPANIHGRAIGRSELDWALVEEAIRAGAVFEPDVTVRQALIVDSNRTQSVGGVLADSRNRQHRFQAAVTIAADGRRSTLAFGLGLARHPVRPRRWAVGAYVESVPGTTSCGEMHIRRGAYIGVAPVPDGRTNVCLVKPFDRGDRGLGDPAELLLRTLRSDRLLRERFEGARFIGRPVVLGPLAVDVTGVPPDGLILAGDAAGFVDPMTGDGLRFAVRGGELAAAAALDALQHGWRGLQQTVGRRRRHEFGAKWRFNRTLRGLVASPLAVRAAAAGARLAPGLVRALIARAGDCDLAG